MRENDHVERVVRLAFASLLAVLAGPASAVEIGSPPGALHGFPSMSDEAGHVVADGELTQERDGARLVVHARWVFRDGRVVEEAATFTLSPGLAQERFEWVETDADGELRRFEVDFDSGRARSAVRRDDGTLDRDEASLELPAGRSFTGYGIALAASQLPLKEGTSEELTFVAFTPKPRTVTLEISNEGSSPVAAAGRSIACVRYRLHPKLPFPVSLFVDAPDAHLWFTRRAPRALIRAEQNLIVKDDPRVTIDVIPRGPARPATARSGEAESR